MRIFIVGWLLLAIGCSEKKCTDETTDATPGGVHYRWSGCSDGANRTLKCDLGGGKFTCTCTKDGKAGATFHLPSKGTVSTELVSREVAKKECGWDFAP
jgi:hypothetical protein